jgi:integrase
MDSGILEDTSVHKLSALSVKNAKPGAKLGDGGGLRLEVDRNGNRRWVFRFTSPTTGGERFMGLGSADDVGLSDAREAAQAARTLVRQHVDPIEARDAARDQAKADAARGVSFETYAKGYIATHEGGWRNPKHRQQWRNSLALYAFPIIGATPIANVDTEAVLKVLRPIWTNKRETAARLRGRIEVILSAAKVEGLRTGENPALWRGHIDQLLPGRKRSITVKHHAALPYEQAPAFWKSLAADTSPAARMLRYIILTACRFNEVHAMNGSEIEGDTWKIPAERMKAGRPHIVPLTPLALDQLPFEPVSDVSLAKCIRRHTSVPATTHGMRSTFRDWCGDCTSFPRDLAEMALAHKVGDETELAYRRATALAKRRELMNAWADFLGRDTAPHSSP